MTKIINPCMCDVRGAVKARGFVKIEFKDGKLSIHGVIGPTKNGNARGSSGQCVDEIRKGHPVKGWTQDMIDKLCNIWGEWHLNDSRPYCEHQKQLGWNKLSEEKVTFYRYSLTSEAISKKNSVEKLALDSLRNGEPFIPTAEQSKIASLKYSIVLPEEISGELTQFYKPKVPLYAGDDNFVKIEYLGLLREDEHPRGILCKPCPVCGYKYGTSWRHEEVPKEIIEWLFDLPDSMVKPAWI